jgi:hypothetical protein
MNLKHALAWAGMALAGGLLIAPSSARALEPAYGPGIVVDGDPSEWNLAEDFFSDMYNAGRNQPSWPGFAVLSRVYLRYNCATHVLNILVLDVEDGMMVDTDPQSAWVKFYGVGLPGDKLIDDQGNGGTTPRSFAWVHTLPSDPFSPVIGYEASAQLDEGAYANIEVHLNIEGQTSSSGRYSQGMAISLSVTCDGITVGAVEAPVDFRLSAAQPNPFNPSTTLTVSLAETGPASLKVYDLAGHEVATLLDGVQAAGERQVTFQAGQLPSGTYFAVLRGPQGVSSQKLLLLK